MTLALSSWHQVVTASFAVFSVALWATVFSSANKEPYNCPWMMHKKLVFHIFSTPLPLILGEKVPVPLKMPESSLQSALWPAFTLVACFKGQHVHKTTVATAWSRTLELSCELICYFMCMNVLCAWMFAFIHVCVLHVWLMEARRRCQISWNQNYRCCEPHLGTKTPCFPQEQQDDPFFQPSPCELQSHWPYFVFCMYDNPHLPPRTEPHHFTCNPQLLFSLSST